MSKTSPGSSRDRMIETFLSYTPPHHPRPLDPRDALSYGSSQVTLMPRLAGSVTRQSSLPIIPCFNFNTHANQGGTCACPRRQPPLAPTPYLQVAPTHSPFSGEADIEMASVCSDHAPPNTTPGSTPDRICNEPALCVGRLADDRGSNILPSHYRNRSTSTLSRGAVSIWAAPKFGMSVSVKSTPIGPVPFLPLKASSTPSRHPPPLRPIVAVPTEEGDPISLSILPLIPGGTVNDQIVKWMEDGITGVRTRVREAKEAGLKSIHDSSSLDPRNHRRDAGWCPYCGKKSSRLANVYRHIKYCPKRAGENGKGGLVRYSTSGLSIQDIIDAYITKRLAVSWEDQGQCLGECKRLASIIKIARRTGKWEAVRQRYESRGVISTGMESAAAAPRLIRPPGETRGGEEGHIKLQQSAVDLSTVSTSKLQTLDLRRRSHDELLDQGYGSPIEYSSDHSSP